MSPSRFKILLGVAAVLLVVVIWRWVSGWGLVTIHQNDAPIAKIIKSIEKQGGIKMITNADPNLPVTLHVDKVPPAEAVAALSDWIEANWSVTYVAGSDVSVVKSAEQMLASGQRDENFRTFRAGGWGGGPMMGGDAPAADPRKIVWNVSPSDSGDLQSYLDQFSQKTGASALIPADWNPKVDSQPKTAAASSAVHSLIKSVNGSMDEVFVLRVSNDDQNGPPPSGDAQRTAGGPSSQDGGGRPDWGGRGRSNPEWAQERVEAQIAQLPKDQQEQARKDMTEMREFWDKMRSLPEEERRAAMDKMFNDPTFQERMMVREASRENRRSPEARADRYRRYIDYKTSVENGDQPQNAPQGGGPGRGPGGRGS